MLLFSLNLFVDGVTSVLFLTIDYICICVLTVFVCKSFFRSLANLLTIKIIDKKLFLFLAMNLLAMRIIDKSFSLVESLLQIRFIESFLQTFSFFLSTLLKLLRLLITSIIQSFLLFVRMSIFFKTLISILIIAIKVIQKLKCFSLKAIKKKDNYKYRR